MRKTVSDTDRYVESVLADYPFFPSHAKAFLAEELTALQRGYFSLCPDTVSKTKPLSSDFTIPLSALCDDGEGVPLPKDIVTLFHGGKELPKRDILHFYRSKEECFTVEKERILLHSSEIDETVTVLFSVCPSDITLDAEGAFTGDVCVAQEHLPMLSARLRELSARLSGEEEEADHFADCYNAWLKRLKEERGEKA